MNRSSAAIAIAIVVVTCLVGAGGRRASGAIVVESGLTQLEGLDGIRAQAIITEATGFGTTNTAVAIKEFTASILFRDGEIRDGIQVIKSDLTAAQAYGLGLPGGNQNPPTTDPEGPWRGLVWPFRDQYDYFPDPLDPLGDDVGIPFQDQPGVYGFVNIAGIARGGPTDPEPAGGDPSRLQRGLDGNGLTGPATYFLFDVIPLLPSDREVRVTIFGASAIVVQRNNQTGQFSEILVPVPDFHTTIRLPEPGAAMLAGAVACAALRRTRRRQC